MRFLIHQCPYGFYTQYLNRCVISLALNLPFFALCSTGCSLVLHTVLGLTVLTRFDV
ncbi:hypothetical protein BDV93DRAFT_151221 [Ceratobasidium sp. AG-I]|nr:hypothetical protein BDV93DRAFT_151221 [Ceratobasidium sp. AG-I]